MRHVNHGHAKIFVDVLDLILHLLSQLLVKRSEGLIH